MSELYDFDTVRGSERQSERPRRVAASEPLNEGPRWHKIIEEIESVGRSERSALARNSCWDSGCHMTRPTEIGGARHGR
jgi:hypothetical protein